MVILKTITAVDGLISQFFGALEQLFSVSSWQENPQSRLLVAKWGPTDAGKGEFRTTFISRYLRTMIIVALGDNNSHRRACKHDRRN
jgi:hypothetical protein